jgi:hypothetical protein
MSGLRLTFMSRIAYASENSADPFTCGSAKYLITQAGPCGKSAMNEMGSMQLGKMSHAETSTQRAVRQMLL